MSMLIIYIIHNYKHKFQKFSDHKNFVCFVQDVVIQQDDEIRLKIVGTRVDAAGIVSKHRSMGSSL